MFQRRWIWIIWFALALVVVACTPETREPSGEPTATLTPLPITTPTPLPTVTSNEVALTWHREGGFAGFCDGLLVYLNGEAFATSCKGVADQNRGQGQLSPEQLRQLVAWVEVFEGFEMEQKDPAVADAMTIQVVLYGQGEKEATEADQQAVQAFAAQVFQEITAAKPSS